MRNSLLASGAVLLLTDAPLGWATRHAITQFPGAAPLTFVPGEVLLPLVHGHDDSAGTRP
jgi:hypothetical protein